MAPSLALLEKVLAQADLPLWINADVLPGPGGQAEPLDPQAFLSAVRGAPPHAVLSLGWTTGWTAGTSNPGETLLLRDGLSGPVWGCPEPRRVTRVRSASLSCGTAPQQLGHVSPSGQTTPTHTPTPLPSSSPPVCPPSLSASETSQWAPLTSDLPCRCPPSACRLQLGHGPQDGGPVWSSPTRRLLPGASGAPGPVLRPAGLAAAAVRAVRRHSSGGQEGSCLC